MEAEERIRATPEAPEAVGPPPERDRTDGRGEPPDAIAHERCLHHPTRAAVARCSACEEPVCLQCAVPVRGSTIGPECLAAELGDPALTVPPEPAAPVHGSLTALAGAVVAVVATLGPWTRTGAGDRFLGAWVPNVRWSMVAALAAITLLVAAWWFRRRGTPAGATTVAIAAALVLAGSVLAIAFPPTFQTASWGAWLGAAGGAIAIPGPIVRLAAERRPGQGV